MKNKIILLALLVLSINTSCQKENGDENELACSYGDAIIESRSGMVLEDQNIPDNTLLDYWFIVEDGRQRYFPEEYTGEGNVYLYRDPDTGIGYEDKDKGVWSARFTSYLPPSEIPCQEKWILKKVYVY